MGVLLKVRALLGDLEPLDAPLPDAEEVAVVLFEHVGELTISGLEVLLELVELEDAVEVLAHVVLGPLDHLRAERVRAAADLDNVLTFDALRRGVLGELPFGLFAAPAESPFGPL